MRVNALRARTRTRGPVASAATVRRLPRVGGTPTPAARSAAIRPRPCFTPRPKRVQDASRTPCGSNALISVRPSRRRAPEQPADVIEPGLHRGQCRRQAVHQGEGVLHTQLGHPARHPQHRRDLVGGELAHAGLAPGQTETSGRDPATGGEPLHEQRDQPQLARGQSATIPAPARRAPSTTSSSPAQPNGPRPTATVASETSVNRATTAGSVASSRSARPNDTDRSASRRSVGSMVTSSAMPTRYGQPPTVPTVGAGRILCCGNKNQPAWQSHRIAASTSARARRWACSAGEVASSAAATYAWRASSSRAALLEEVGPHGGQPMVGRQDAGGPKVLDQGQPGLRTLEPGQGDRPVQRDHRGQARPPRGPGTTHGSPPSRSPRSSEPARGLRRPRPAAGTARGRRSPERARRARHPPRPDGRPTTSGPARPAGRAAPRRRRGPPGASPGGAPTRATRSPQGRRARGRRSGAARRMASAHSSLRTGSSAAVAA